MHEQSTAVMHFGFWQIPPELILPLIGSISCSVCAMLLVHSENECISSGTAYLFLVQEVSQNSAAVMNHLKSTLKEE